MLATASVMIVPAPNRGGNDRTRSDPLMTSHSADAATLGEPSYVWRSGQERRLDLIRQFVPIEEQSILDVGCGIGMYLHRVGDFTARAYGIDVSLNRLRTAAESVPNVLAAVGEHLPFADRSFDMVLLNEVIEHVQDDRQTLQECLRILRPGGHIVIFAPNRLYPFETHGIYWGDRYIFGNIPLVNYLPDVLRDHFVPHARAYRARDLRRLIDGLNVRPIVHSYVYPGFDNIAGRSPIAARLLRGGLYRAEHTPVRKFGISHFLILEKRADG
jgi:SAM-dependent methyltransferase